MLISSSQMSVVRDFADKFGRSPWHTRLHNYLVRGDVSHEQWLEVTQIKLAAEDIAQQCTASSPQGQAQADEFVRAATYVCEYMRGQLAP